jgi:urocanate hydratase
MSENKRKKYVTEKSINLDAMMKAAKEFEFQYKPTKIDLSTDHAEVAKMTQDVCLRPDLYLNNDDTCIKCGLYEHCSCKLKNLGKQKKK